MTKDRHGSVKCVHPRFDDEELEEYRRQRANRLFLKKEQTDRIVRLEQRVADLEKKVFELKGLPDESSPV